MTPIVKCRRRTHLLWAATAMALTALLVGAPILATPAAAAAPSGAPSSSKAVVSSASTAPKAATTIAAAGTTIAAAGTKTKSTTKSAVSNAATAAGSASLTSFPNTPPAQICGNAAMLSGPASAPLGAVTVLAGDNSLVNWNRPGTTFWFASGYHTLGSGQFSQIITASNTTFIGAPGSVIDGQNLNQYAFTQTASGVTIRYLTIQHFVAPRDQGVVNHNSGTNWMIQYNTIAYNTGAGVMVGPGNIVSYNCLTTNGQYGFSAYKAGGNSNITIDHNEVVGNNTGNWGVVDPGCGCSGAGKVWNTIGGAVTNNWVHNNIGPGIWADTNNAGILIDGNYINDNDDEAIIYELSYNGRITNNNILRNTLTKGRAYASQTNFPIGTIYISESGGDSRVDGGLYSTFEISGNNLVDNWGGVTLWEDAGRFCGSELNSIVCTIANPTANLGTCVAGVINNPPYFADCRWKTQNVLVHDNYFGFSRANVGCTTTGCGEQAVLANAGTTPWWSPYLGNVVNAAITTQQNNHFASNTYVGDWQFDWSSTTPFTFTQWQGGPYNQDAGSTLNGVNYPPAIPGNLFDADTSSLEGSIGDWVPWFSSTITQSTAQAQSGGHSLQVNITATYGWGVQLNNWPGFAAAPGPQTVSFWGLAGTGTFGVDMQVQWRTATGAVLATNDVPLNTLLPTWQQASANVLAPPGTVTVTATITGLAGNAGVAGSVGYLDQLFVGSTPVTGTNLLDNDTASMEGSAGHWTPWFATALAQTTAQAEVGTHSLQVSLTAPYGWGVQLDNWPGFSATAGLQTMSFWALGGAGSLGASMQAQWRDSNGNVLGTSSASLATLSSTWQQAAANVVAPAGTAKVTVTFTGVTGVTGNYLYLDQIFVGAAPTNGVNTLDADTASMENSIGRWTPWFSCTLATTTSQAEAGTHSLQVSVTSPNGWGVQLNTWPGLATTPGPRIIRFWGRAGTGSLGVTMQVQWRDTSGNVLSTTNAAIPALTATWQQATTSATAPAGTAFVTVTFTGTGGAAGNSLYLDDVYVGT